MASDHLASCNNCLNKRYGGLGYDDERDDQEPWIELRYILADLVIVRYCR